MELALLGRSPRTRATSWHSRPARPFQPGYHQRPALCARGDWGAAAIAGAVAFTALRQTSKQLRRSRCRVRALTERDTYKLDGTPDELFYLIPRIGVYHVDDAFRAQLTQLYKVLIPAGGQVLDLCSQHDSHLPTDVNYALTVHGMNQLELLANTRAASRFTRNFNNDPTLPEFEDDTFDAVLMAVSIQYMQNPVRLISEVRRVLRPGGTFTVSFSNRMFFTKAVEVWRSQQTMRGLADLVMGYFSEAGFTDVRAANRVRGAVDDTDWLRGDPFIAVVGIKEPGRDLSGLDGVSWL